MQPSFPKRFFYDVCHLLARLLGAGFFRVRCEGRQHVPSTGGVIICSNHQSNLDPVLVGLACDRPMWFLARRTLFTFTPFRWIADILNAIPMDREGFSLSGMRMTLQRLRVGEMVLIFPEGTRTRDGEIAPLKPGVALLMRRASVPVVPMGIEGAYEAWPRTRRVPRVCTIHICIGAPILHSDLATMSDSDLLDELARRMHACHAEARRARLVRMGHTLAARFSRGAVAPKA